MADTLSCQRETLHSQQLRSIKKSIDSDHGIYRDCHGRCAPEWMKLRMLALDSKEFSDRVSSYFPAQKSTVSDCV